MRQCAYIQHVKFKTILREREREQLLKL